MGKALFYTMMWPFRCGYISWFHQLIIFNQSNDLWHQWHPVQGVTLLRAMKVIHQIPSGWTDPFPWWTGRITVFWSLLQIGISAPQKKHNFFNFTCFFWPLWWCLHFWCILAEGTIFPVSRLGSWWRTSGWTERWTEVTLQQNPQIYSKMKTTRRLVEWAEKIMEGFAIYFWGGCSLLEACRCSQ